MFFFFRVRSLFALFYIFKGCFLLVGVKVLTGKKGTGRTACVGKEKDGDSLRFRPFLVRNDLLTTTTTSPKETTQLSPDGGKRRRGERSPRLYVQK